MGDVRNVQGRYWNYVLHSWKLFSVSPFHTSVAIVDESIYNDHFTPAPYLVNLTTGEKILATDTLELNKPYGISFVPLPNHISGVQIVNVESNSTGVTLTYANNTVTFTSFGELETGDDVEILVTYTNGYDEGTSVGVAP